MVNYSNLKRPIIYKKAITLSVDASPWEQTAHCSAGSLSTLIMENTFYNKINTLFNGLAMVALVTHLLTPNLAQAAQTRKIVPTNLATIETVLKETPEMHLMYPDLPSKKPNTTVAATISAYTSTPDQTDSTPFIAASGKRVHDGMIAANWLPFGTIVKIPSLFGDKEFIVEDRMNPRYGHGHMDIWFDGGKADARKFGVRHRIVEIYYQDKK